MVRRGARGDGFLHGEAPSERPTFRGCRGGRRDRYRISDHRCMFRVNGYGGYTHCGDVPDYASSNDDSHDEASSSSDDFGSQFISWRAARQGVGRVDSIKEAGGAGAVGWPEPCPKKEACGRWFTILSNVKASYSTTYSTTNMHPDMMERGAKACPAELGFPFDESYKLNMHFPNLLQCWVLGCDKGSQRSQKTCWPSLPTCSSRIGSFIWPC
ncbi:uncharacterized protein [Lolium perenne]|uniref:uncharacterized protein isoform X3 n=1 Tax=Lolium perenne TaxID=4522 RepID=UPI0021F5523C|nr:uncharacterized protein LOC127293140 isoform X2 [Lolium perenne]